jgi:hypothetical protein
MLHACQITIKDPGSGDERIFFANPNQNWDKIVESFRMWGQE